MSTWITVDENLDTHPRTVNLKAILALATRREAMSYPIMLWKWAIKHAWRDGNLEALGDDGIEQVCEWTGKRGDLVKALRECGPMKGGKKGPGFLEAFVLHNWTTRSNRLITQRLTREEWRASKRKGRPVDNYQKPAEKVAKAPAAAPSNGAEHSPEDMRKRRADLLEKRKAQASA